MRPPISGNIKATLIQQWLEGKSRDQIARDNAVGAGTVTNILNEWRSNLGYPVAEDLRELAVTLRKLRMNPSRCALGARIASMMKILGQDEEEFDEFLSIIYKDCITLGIKPNKVAYNLKQLLELCQHVPFPEIPNYIQQQKTQKRKLEQELQELEARVVDAKNRVDKALEENDIIRRDLNFKRELWKREISMDEVSQFLEALEGIKRHGFDPATVVSRYRNFRDRDAGKIAVEELKKEVNCLQEEVSAHRQVIREYEQLKSMGFGLKELRQLANTVKEIALANKMSPYEAVPKFIADTEDQYDKKLGFELKLENLKSEIQKNEHRRATPQNQSYGIDWNSFVSLFSGVDIRQGQVKACDNFRRVDPAAAADSKQQAKTKGDDATGPGNIPQSQATNANEADKEEQEEDALYNYLEPLQKQQQPNNDNKKNRSPTTNIESAIQTFISNSLNEQGTNSSNFLNYENSKYGLKLQYPSDWVYREIDNSIPSNTSLSPQIIVIFTSLKLLQGQPIASVGIGVMNLPSPKITLDEFTTLNLNNLRQSNPDFQLIGSDSAILFGGNQANELVYTVGGEKTRYCRLFTIIGDKVYIIQYEAQSEYPAYVSTAQKLVHSIELSTATT